MIYFYLWVIVLAAVIFAVPIAAYIERSRNKKEAAPMGATENSEAQEVAFDEPAPSESVQGDGFEEFGASVPAGADDFSAFDDFK